MQSLGNKNQPKFQPLANLGPSGIEFSFFLCFFCKIQHFGGEPPPNRKSRTTDRHLSLLAGSGCTWGAIFAIRNRFL